MKKKHRQVFRISGGLRTPSKASLKRLLTLKKEGNRSVVPGHEVYFGDLWATRYLRVIRKKCAVERVLNLAQEK